MFPGAEVDVKPVSNIRQGKIQQISLAQDKEKDSTILNSDSLSIT